MLAAGFHDFSGKSLSNLDRFGDTAAFRDQARHIRTRSQVAAVLQILDSNSNGDLFDFREMDLPFHL
jgi:hypothetical protein